MPLLPFILICGAVLAAAVWLVRGSWYAQRTARSQVAILIAIAITGLFLAVLLSRWLKLELNSALLTAVGAFFLTMAWSQGDSPDAEASTRGRRWNRLGLGALGLLLVLAATRRSAGITTALDYCRAEYTAAAADTNFVDAVVPPGSPRPISRYGRTMTCGRYRLQQFRP